MRISAQQRQQNEARVRTAMDRLLRGQIPPGGKCDIKTLAREANVDRTAFYGHRPYAHLREEFEQRLQALHTIGDLPDPRHAQIARLRNELDTLKQRIARRDQTIAELTDVNARGTVSSRRPTRRDHPPPPARRPHVSRPPAANPRRRHRAMQLTATAAHLAPRSSAMSITCPAEKRDTQHHVDSERGHHRSARRNRTRTRLHTATADRRRIFITDAILHGMPPHIAQLVEVMKQVVERTGMTEVTIAYGMTETSPVSTQTRASDSLDRRVCTVGQVHPHLEIKIVDPETGSIVPRGVSGELCTRGYSVMVGYWEQLDKTAEVLDAAGWMHSGDLAAMESPVG